MTIRRAAAFFLVLPLLAGCGGARGGGARQPSGTGQGGGAVTSPGTGDAGGGDTTGAAQDDISTPLQCPAASDPMDFGPIIWPDGASNRRWMIDETDVADVKSSKERPVDVCGVTGELEWLMRLTCSDGSHPYPDMTTAHESRTGNVGPGGRCGKIIDLYVVPCPDKQYEVYMDMYQCLPGETFS
jgi:hypothetical protein